MTRIPLPGLIGSHPLGALAAFGLLRICSDQRASPSVKLGWSLEGNPHAELVTERSWTPADLVGHCLTHMRGREQLPAFSRLPPADCPPDDTEQVSPAGLRDDLKGEPCFFGRLLRAWQHAATQQDRESIDFLAAFASELITARSTGDLKPTAFHMTAGQQRFLRSLRELAASLDPRIDATDKKAERRREEIRVAFQEALFGPWRYADEYHSLGWDPNTEALYALSAVSPSDSGPKSVRAAVWLVVEALPLFPCFPLGAQLHTRGFTRRGTTFRWPLWKPPISVDTLRSLLGLPELYDAEVQPTTLAYRGVERVYQSARPTSDKGYGMFRSATPAQV